MSVLSQVVSEAYPVGNNSTTTPYVITMERDLDEDLKLEVDGVVTTAFTVSGAEFRTNPAIPATSSLRLYRDTPKTQLQTFPSNTTPAAEDVRAALDKMTMIVQEDTGRVSPYSVGSTFVGTDTVGVGDFGKQCLVVASGDTDITLTDGTEQGQRLAFFVSNSSRDRVAFLNQGGTDLWYSNGSAILAELSWNATSADWIATSFFDNPIKEKGDIMVGIGSNERVHLPVGTNGQVLTVDSTETSGLKWVTP